jgi:bacterioferritin-associated ferredoxin
MLRVMEGSAALSEKRCGRLAAAMTRCECAELPFGEIRRRLSEGCSLEQLQDETGAGMLCTACLPDLREHLARAGEPR